jgi:hypothetical protein
VKNENSDNFSCNCSNIASSHYRSGCDQETNTCTFPDEEVGGDIEEVGGDIEEVGGDIEEVGYYYGQKACNIDEEAHGHFDFEGSREETSKESCSSLLQAQANRSDSVTISKMATR